MPRRSGRDTSDDDDSDRARKNPRRGGKSVSYNEDKTEGDDPMEVEEENSASEEEDVGMDADVEEEAGSRRRPRAAKGKKADSPKDNSSDKERRTSSRATKFKGGMKEPSESVRDLLKDTTTKASNDKASKARRKASFEESSSDEESDNEPITTKKAKRQSQANKRGKTSKQESSPHKSPARRHKQTRLTIKTHTTLPPDSEDSEESEAEDEYDDDEEEEPFKIQRIIASRTEPRSKWVAICKKMNTTEIDDGSRWVQESSDDNDDDDDPFEERFLVKWHDMSYVHVSWETESDLLEQVEGARNYLNTFFRKSKDGYLFDADERCDGDYFDPAWRQIDRIVEVQYPEACPCKSVKDEDKVTNKDLGIVLDKSDPDFGDGLGREFLVKWGNQGYSEGTYEFERDLILNDVEYKDELKRFLATKKKPTKDKARKFQKEGEAEVRRLYKFLFGDNSNAKEEKGVEEYQKKLQEHVYKNGGQLRDYQSVGVSWLIANLVNKRSCILADEMGLGKTLQTASFINLIATQLKRRGPFLIVAPLSTLAHWQREFMGWTDLNTIVYHGSAKDRELIRELEFAYEIDRPKGGVGFNQLYLKKCKPKKNSPSVGNHWMAEVVITTPELLTADDYGELTAVDWECLVVDEAQKLKNHSSKLATNLRDDKFVFKHKLLLTGTPIQNSMEELFALLNFIDSDRFPDCDEFMEKYGDIKSKEKIDQLHEEIRPYILRRLKEDAEKSVPPKEETVIEVELTVAQKKYYRALYEKNVKFLHKNKKKALDGPSLNNLAMQLRKCCNHLFLLNGIEEEFRASQESEGNSLSEVDLLVKASGKLVLLDKLLPRLKENGHRILIFSQFSKTLDLLEDYLANRKFKAERIDGSITGKKRQQAIDRFQAPSVDGKEQPFVMLLTTRAGGVGINLTAADTCIIFDSDWNPQNDLQAQARCHRIGQTKNVKVFRLLTRNTYELQMFHMSSMKMGLDQAVLSGFESGASGDGALSKEEIEKLLRHGAYGIFTEDQEGAEESNAFVQQDIDTILERRSRKVVHENTGSGSSAAGGTFSKARFAAPSATDGKKGSKEDVDIDDEDFWKKMVGEGHDDPLEDDLAGKRRKRKVTNYSEGLYEKKIDQSLRASDDEADDDDDASESEDDDSYASGDEGDKRDRYRWGGSKPSQWKLEEAKKLVSVLLAHGYGTVPWYRYIKELASKNGHSEDEVRRMCWSTLLVAICEFAEDDASSTQRRAVRAAEKKREADSEASPTVQGGVLAGSQQGVSVEEKEALVQKCFDKLWASNSAWASRAMKDALVFAKNGVPRSEETVARVLRNAATPMKQDEITTKFVQTVWPSLKNRGWKATVISEGSNSGKTQYDYDGKQYYSPEAVLAVAGTIHPELAKMVESMQSVAESSRQKSKESEAKLREKHLAMKAGTISVKDLSEFLSKYSPLQLLYDRKHSKKLSLTPRRLMQTCNHMHTATTLVKKAGATRDAMPLIDHLASALVVDKRASPPHPQWSSKHDAVLIHAVAKHGWIENETSCRRIINDSEVTWGFPFDSGAAAKEGNEGNKTTEKTDIINSLRETASRAADFFNAHNDILKGFNDATVVRTYNLVQEANEENEEEETQNENPKWEVDDEALVASTGFDSDESQEVDLPPKKDLAKRIKQILSKNVGNSFGSRAASSPSGLPGVMQVDSKGEKDFCVIDQGDRCNILLAEILAAVVKAKSLSAMKLLCSIAAEEATKRKASILSRPESQDPKKNEKRSKAEEEMTEVIKNIGLAKRHLKGQSRQSKNIIRVMIGHDAVKHIRDPTFPVEGSLGGVGSMQKLTGQRQGSNGPKSKKEESACGDKALTRAIAKCYDKNNGGPGRVSPEGHVSDLELTAIETLIISVVCSQGLPVWTENMSSLLVVDAVETSGENPQENSLTLSWIGLGSILSSAARDWHETAARKVDACQQEYDKHEDKSDESQPKTRARKNLVNAIRIAEIKETAAGQAAEYAEDPSILAQKTVMLIERLRRKMGNPAGGHTKSSKKVNHWLGPKCFDFLSSQLGQWANTLDIVDGKGDTLSYTAADFYHDLPDEEREHVEVAATLNKMDCRSLCIQITSVLRLRSLFMQYSKEVLKEKIDRAAKATKTQDSWESQPDWWRVPENPSHHDALLAESIVEYGFCGVLENARGFGPPDKAASGQTSLKDLGLTKVIIQQRINQLARELHDIERNANTTRVIANFRQKDKAADAEKKEKKGGTGKGSKGGKKQTQTALHSFFSKTGNSKKAGSVVVLSDTEDDSTKPKENTVDVVEIDMSPLPSKEGGDDVAMATVDAPGEEPVDAPGEKRTSDGSFETSASPEKKLRSA